jgi:hypothetical protein
VAAATSLWSDGDLKRFKSSQLLDDENASQSVSQLFSFGSGDDEVVDDTSAWRGDHVWFGRPLPSAGAAAVASNHSDVDVAAARARGPGIIGMPLSQAAASAADAGGSAWGSSPMGTPLASGAADGGNTWGSAPVGTPPPGVGAVDANVGGGWDSASSRRQHTGRPLVLGSAALLDPGEADGWPVSPVLQTRGGSWSGPAAMDPRPGWPPSHGQGQPTARAAQDPWPSNVVGGLSHGQGTTLQPPLTQPAVIGHTSGRLTGSSSSSPSPLFSAATTTSLDSPNSWPLSHLRADDTAAQRQGHGYA